MADNNISDSESFNIDYEFTNLRLGKSFSCEKLDHDNSLDISNLSGDFPEFSRSFAQKAEEEIRLNEIIDEEHTELEEQAMISEGLKHFNDTFSSDSSSDSSFSSKIYAESHNDSKSINIDYEFTNVKLRKSFSCEKLDRDNSLDISNLSVDSHEFSRSFAHKLEDEIRLNEIIDEQHIELDEQAMISEGLKHFNDTFSLDSSSDSSFSLEHTESHNNCLVRAYQDYVIQENYFDELLDELEYQERVNEAFVNFDDKLFSFDDEHLFKEAKTRYSI